MNQRDIGVILTGVLVGTLIGVLVFNPGGSVDVVGDGIDTYLAGPISSYLSGPLEAHYTFDNGDQFVEEYGPSYLPDGINLSTGIDGQGLRFNMPHQPITLAPQDIDRRSSMTVMLWVRSEATAPTNITPPDFPIMFQQGGNQETDHFVLQGGLSEAGSAFIAGDHPETGLASPPLDAGWHHLAASFDGATMRLYVDGQPIAQRTAHANNSFEGLTRPWTLGSADLDATIDEVRIYNMVVDESEVQSVYAQHADRTSRTG